MKVAHAAPDTPMENPPTNKRSSPMFSKDTYPHSQAVKNLKNKPENVIKTEGDPKKIIFRFAQPLIFANLFQQLYNTMDTTDCCITDTAA